MDTIIRTTLVYFMLLFLLRVTTRRLMRSATPLDIAIIFLFGGISLQAVLGQDHSILSSLLAIGTIAIIHIALTTLKRRFAAISHIIDGTPVVIYQAGQWDKQRMKRMRVQTQDVLAEARQRGFRNLDNVEFVTVEHNGAITLVDKIENGHKA